MAKWVRQVKAQIDPGTITIGNVGLTDPNTGAFATISDGALYVKLDKPVTVDVALSETNDSVAIYGMSEGSFKAIATNSDGITLTRVVYSERPSDAASYTEQVNQTVYLSDMYQQISEIKLDTQYLSDAYNFSASSFDTTETSPALLQTHEAALMSDRIAVGSEASVNIIAYNKSTYQIIASDISDGGVISIESSLNNANWYTETTLSITSDGSNLYSIDGKRKYVRPNLTVCSDGKYTVLLLAGN